MTVPYGLPSGTTIARGQLGFPGWVDELCRQWKLDSSTYGGHQEADRPDIGAAPNPDRLNRGIDWWGDPDRLLEFAHWLVNNGPPRSPGYGPPGLEMVIYQHPVSGEAVWYPPWVNFSNDLSQHTDHVHTRFSQSVDFAPVGVLTVPLVAQPGGKWTSSSPAWAHLIMRESGGDPTIIQQIVDVNTGGNEAEGLFQITPATWRAHGGEQFAPTPRLASPPQQALVAARIFVANPSGSDWGAGLPGREDPTELAAGLVPVTQEEDDMFTDDDRRMLQRVNEELTKLFASRSPYRRDSRPIDTLAGITLNADGMKHAEQVEQGAYAMIAEDIADVQRVADGHGEPMFGEGVWEYWRQRAQRLLAAITTAPTTMPSPPASTPPPTSGATPPVVSTPPPPVVTPPPPVGPKPVIYCVDGFQSDMWSGPPATVGRALEDVYWFQPVGYDSGAFPLGVGRDSGVAELKRLIREHQGRDPGRRFALFGFSLGAVIVDDVFDALRSGDLQQHWSSFVGGAKIGDPRRERGVSWGGPLRSPPNFALGQGIAGSGNLKQTPDNFRSFLYPANFGDIYSNAGLNPLTGAFDQSIADDMELVYNAIMCNFDGAIMSVILELQELLTRTGQAGLSIIMAAVNGVGFAANQNPHMAYPLDDAIAFLRSLV